MLVISFINLFIGISFFPLSDIIILSRQ